MARHYIFGDIHGCWDELRDLLDRLSPAEGDRLVALGDVVDRGPASEKVLEFFLHNEDATALMGNHERKHLRSARGTVRAALSQLIVREQLGPRYEAWLDHFETFPRFLEIPEAILVHGFFEPGIPLAEQREEVIVGTMSGERQVGAGGSEPWYERYEGPKPLVVGHHHYLGNGRPLVREGLIHGIDTGCVHGFRLTALVLPEFELVSVPARGNHWQAQKLCYPHLAPSLRTAEEDVEWPALRSLAGLPEGLTVSPKRRERAEKAAGLLERAERLVPVIVERAREVAEAIQTELAEAGDWAGCADRERAGRFARRAAEHEWRYLLFQERKGRLTPDQVWSRCRTPNELLALAASMELEG